MTKSLLLVITLFVFGLTLPLGAQGVFFEEDFDGAIPGTWTSVMVEGNGLAFSEWVFTTEGPQGPFSIGELVSTTAANGWVMFDSDSNCSHPDPQDAWLISPALDCSGNTFVFLQFETHYRSFNDRPAIMVGTNLGDLSTWTEFEVFPGIQANQYGDYSNSSPTNPVVVTMDLSSAAAGQAQVYFAFRFHSSSETENGGNLTGCGYSWQVDDVSLHDQNLIPPHDMQVNTNWYAVAPNLIWPLDMVETFGFLADIQNVGSQAQTNVTLNISIEDEGANVVYTEDLDYGTIDPDSLAENVPFPGDGFLPTEMGVYLGTYSISADSTDGNLDNNTATFEFLVSDTLFSKENGAAFITGPAGSNWDAGEAWSWAYGNYFYVPEANNNVFSYAFFSVDAEAAQAGENVTVQIYKWTDNNADEQADPDERTNVATMVYTIVGDESGGDVIALPVTTLLGDPVALEDNTEYLVMAEYSTDVEGATIAMGVSADVDYGAMILRSQLDGSPRYGSFLGINDPLEDEPYSSLGFGTDLVPTVRVSFGQPSNVKENILLDAELAVFPNPADNQVSLGMEFKEIMENVTIQLFDINGKLMRSLTTDNVKQHQVSFDVKDLANGAYVFKVTTEKGTRSELFNVQH